MQYNGENGCWKCLQPGTTVKTGVRGHSRTFPYREDNPKGPIRTSKNVKDDGFEAARCQQQGLNRYVVNGVKGPSWLSLLQHFDLVRGMGIDYMHGVLLGVQKLLLTLWFSPAFSKEHFSMFSKVENVDERLNHYCAYSLSYVDKKATTCPNTACMKGLSSQHAKAKAYQSGERR